LTVEPLELSFWSKQTKFVPFLVTATKKNVESTAEDEAKLREQMIERVKKVQVETFMLDKMN
jgi:hypothetical protein